MMDSGQPDRDPAPVTSSPWRVSKIDLRSPVSDKAWPIARLELEHADRGRVTDIGTAPGAFDAAFVAASHILNIAPKLLAYNVRSAGAGADGALSIAIDIDIELDGQAYRGSAAGLDLLECSLRAWLEAAAQATVGAA